MTLEGAQAIERLFGRACVRAATDTNLLAVSAEVVAEVHAGAGALLARRHDPAAQLRYVEQLPDNVRLLLCLWLMDPTVAAKLTERVQATVQ